MQKNFSFLFYSTISSGYNAVAAILLEDFVKPSFPNMKSSTMTLFSKIVSKYIHICFGWFMVFNATFSNISVISWRSVLSVEETGGTGEHHQPVSIHWQTLSHNVVSSATCFYIDIDTRLQEILCFTTEAIYKLVPIKWKTKINTLLNSLKI
jgi:hypothetical protein